MPIELSAIHAGRFFFNDKKDYVWKVIGFDKKKPWNVRVDVWEVATGKREQLGGMKATTAFANLASEDITDRVRIIESRLELMPVKDEKAPATK